MKTIPYILMALILRVWFTIPHALGPSESGSGYAIPGAAGLSYGVMITSGVCVRFIPAESITKTAWYESGWTASGTTWILMSNPPQ